MSALKPSRRPGNKTAAELAKEYGVSARTVVRIRAQPRDEYEAQSVSRRKPWEAEGISRATWYRRQKQLAAS
jgi:hypothetical protein